MQVIETWGEPSPLNHLWSDVATGQRIQLYGGGQMAQSPEGGRRTTQQIVRLIGPVAYLQKKSNSHSTERRAIANGNSSNQPKTSLKGGHPKNCNSATRDYRGEVGKSQLSRGKPGNHAGDLALRKHPTKTNPP